MDVLFEIRSNNPTWYFQVTLDEAEVVCRWDRRYKVFNCNIPARGCKEGEQFAALAILSNDGFSYSLRAADA